MKKLLERLVGPLGPLRRVPPEVGRPEPGWQGRWGYVPTDQKRALRVF